MARVMLYLVILMFVAFSLHVIDPGNTMETGAMSAFISPNGTASANNFDSPQNVSWGNLFNQFNLTVAAIGAVVGLFVGFLRGNTLETAAFASITGLIAGWVTGDLWTMTTYYTTQMNDLPFLKAPILATYYSLIAGFFISIISWWRNAD